MLRAGVGYCNETDPFCAGKTVAAAALESGALSRADLVLAFCAGTLDPEAFFKGLQSVVGHNVPIIGGSTIGVITNHYLSYRGFPAAAAVLQSDTCGFRVASSGGLDRDEMSAGKILAGLLPRSRADRVLLAFYDSIRIPATITTPPVLNSSAPLLSGMEAGMAGGIPIVGAGLLGDYDFSATRQFCGDRVAEQHVVGCIASGSFSVYHAIMHGCIPLDGIYHRITRLEGSVLYELDGKPVVPLINELFGNTDWQAEHPVNYLTLGINYGERYGIPQEKSYVNRLITGVTADGRGIGMFEPDLAPGMEIQFMIRDNRIMLDSARENTAELLRRITAGGKRPIFALYIDCAGRTAEQSVTDSEEASEVQKVLNHSGVPLLGFYSGVEIAPFLGRSRGLDWTGVLVVFAGDR